MLYDSGGEEGSMTRVAPKAKKEPRKQLSRRMETVCFLLERVLYLAAHENANWRANSTEGGEKRAFQFKILQLGGQLRCVWSRKLKERRRGGVVRLGDSGVMFGTDEFNGERTQRQAPLFKDIEG